MITEGLYAGARDWDTAADDDDAAARILAAIENFGFGFREAIAVGAPFLPGARDCIIYF